MAENITVDFGQRTNEAIFARVPFLFMRLAGFLVGLAEFCGFFHFLFFPEFAFGLDGQEFFAGAVEGAQLAGFVDAERVEARRQFDGGESLA